ncbi:uncharacterized protein Tco025E_08127 [Trypanosoma conorhini]|uniref:Uncharacterized protein n=1 Tax=Trypanosoma conorhini TaxID=83891 RepID=A0A422NE19_9TRYP|nr:uncharacterized protein Tco025E_08127 [Trypanosoma conorhini]RNF03725.1 hypothetical protein Tco025E_08127 [Trypanosoma conorhini]
MPRGGIGFHLKVNVSVRAHRVAWHDLALFLLLCLRGARLQLLPRWHLPPRCGALPRRVRVSRNGPRAHRGFGAIAELRILPTGRRLFPRRLVVFNVRPLCQSSCRDVRLRDPFAVGVQHRPLPPPPRHCRSGCAWRTRRRPEPRSSPARAAGASK